LFVKESGFVRDLGKALLVFFIFSALLIGVGIGYSVTPVKVVSSIIKEPVFVTVTETSWRTTERVLRETVEHTVLKTMTETITIERTEFVETTTETEAATGTLQQPGEIGHGNFGGKSKVTVINDSPYKLRITLEGKEVIIEKCEVCHVYIIRPIFCPEEDRPSIDIMLKPGTYEVTVSTAEPTDVRPLAGSWTLEPNTWYGFCYYVLKKLA